MAGFKLAQQAFKVCQSFAIAIAQDRDKIRIVAVHKQSSEEKGSTIAVSMKIPVGSAATKAAKHSKNMR